MNFEGWTFFDLYTGRQLRPEELDQFHTPVTGFYRSPAFARMLSEMQPAQGWDAYDAAFLTDLGIVPLED